MKQSRFNCQATAVSSVLSLILLAGSPAWAHNSGDDHGGGSRGGKQSESKTKLRARLSAVETPASDAHGKAEWQTKSKNGKVTERFSAKVEIRCPTDALGITDCTAAETANVHLVLSRPDAEDPALLDDYSDCTLEFDEIETEFEHGSTKDHAEFKVDGRSKNGVIEFSHGSCDDLTPPDDDSVLPGIEAGDTAKVHVIVAGEPVEILQGTFNEIRTRGKSRP